MLRVLDSFLSRVYLEGTNSSLFYGRASQCGDGDRRCGNDASHGVAEEGGFTMTGKLFLALACMCLLAACGHSSPGPTVAASSHIAPPSASAAPTASAVTVGCGTYCQQAGLSQGRLVPRISVPPVRMPAMSASELCLPGKQRGHGHQWRGNGEVELQSVDAVPRGIAHLSAVVLCSRRGRTVGGWWPPRRVGFRGTRRNHERRGSSAHYSRQAGRVRPGHPARRCLSICSTTARCSTRLNRQWPISL